MSDLPKPPKTHDKFNAAFPELGKAWEIIGGAGKQGPLDEKTARLVSILMVVNSGI